MAQKELVYKVKVVNEAGQVVETLAQDINTLNKSVKDLENELNNTELGSEQWKDLQKELKNSKGALNEAQNAGKSLGEQFSSIPGPIGAAAQSVIGLGTAFKALIANPIGAVVAAIGVVFMTLYKALTSTEEGAFKLKEVMGALSGILNPLIKLAQNLALVLVDGVLKGIEGVQKGLNLLGFDQFSKASSDARDLAKSINQVEEAEGDLAVERAKQNKELAQAREIIADTTLSLGERQKALAKVKKSEEDLAAKESALAKRRLENIREQIKQQGASTELLDAEEQALIQLYNTQQNQSAVRRKNIKAEQALTREAAADEKEAEAERLKRAQEREAKEKERLQKKKEAIDFEKALNLELIQDEFDKQVQSIKNQEQTQLEQINSLAVSEEKKKELRVKLAQKTADDIADVEQKRADKKKADDDKAAADEAAKAQKIYQAEVSRVDALLQLEQMKYDTADELAEADLDKTIQLMREKTDLLLQNDQLTAEQRQLIEAQYNEAVKQLGENQLKTRQDLNDKIIQQDRQRAAAAAGALGLIAEAAGETTMVGKVAGVAQATINTYLAATEAYKSVAGIPVIGPGLGVAAAAAAIALGLKQVNEIMSVSTDVPKPKFAGGGIVTGMGGGTMDNIPTMLSNGESVINARSTALFRPTLDLINQLGGGDKFQGGIVNNGVDMAQMELISGVRQKNNRPVQAYVVSSQAENQLQLDRQVKSRSLV